MYPILANLTNTTNTTAVLVGAVDPYTVLILAIIGLLLMVVGLFARGAIISLLAFTLLLIVGITYSGGFAVYDADTNKLIIYKSQPLAFLFITFAIISGVLGIYKILTYPRFKKPSEG